MATHESIHIQAGPYSELVTKWCTARRDDIGRLSTVTPDDLDLDELGTVWAAMKALRDELDVWLRDLAVELGDRIYATPDHEYDHPTLGRIGARRAAQQVRWDAPAVVSALSRRYVDVQTGERVDAVPIDTLAEVVAGYNGSSSRWNVSKHPELKAYRDVGGYGPPLPRLEQ